MNGSIGRKVFLDISIGGTLAGKIIIGLFTETPKTSENFYRLCKGNSKKVNGRVLN